MRLIQWEFFTTAWSGRINPDGYSCLFSGQGNGKPATVSVG